jgi:hypothetical protein
MSAKYDLTGVHGAEVFRDLPDGVKLSLADGAIGEIIANAHDGAIVILRIVDSPKDPSRVGTEETVFYTEVNDVVEDDE